MKEWEEVCREGIVFVWCFGRFSNSNLAIQSGAFKRSEGGERCRHSAEDSR